MLFFIDEICVSFFYKLTLKNTLRSDSYYELNYEDNVQKNYYFVLQLLVVINIAFAVMLSIPYILLSIYFIIFLLVISIPFKNYPVKYFIGIAYGRYG